MTLGGGSLAVQGSANASNSQQFNGLTVNPGSSAIVLTSAGTSNSLLLSLGSISRSPGGTVDFTLPGGTQSATNGITTTTPNNSAGILGAYATVGGTDWASSTNGTAGNITAYTAYTRGDLGALGSARATERLTFRHAVRPHFRRVAGHAEPDREFGSHDDRFGLAGTGGRRLDRQYLRHDQRWPLAGSASGELTVITPANLTIGSAIIDNGGATGLTKAGPAMLTLTGSSTYSGATTIAAGTLQIGNGGASGTLGTGPVSDYSALIFNRSGVTTFGGAIGGGGSLTQAGKGSLILGGSNAYTGGTYVAAGTLFVTNSDALPSGTSLTVGAGGTFVFDPSATVATFSGSATWISTSGSAWNDATHWVNNNQLPGVPGIAPRPANTDTAAFSGSGSVTAIDLTGVDPSLKALSFSTSGYTLSGGSLTLASDSGLATVTVSGTQSIGSLLGLAGSADMVVTGGADRLTISGQIVGSGPLLKDGGGTLILSGSDTYSGGTTIDAGTLYVTSSAALPGETSLTVGPGGTFVFDPSASPALAGFPSVGAVPSPPAVAAVPEPSSLALALAALSLFGLCRRAATGPPQKPKAQARPATERAKRAPCTHGRRGSAGRRVQTMPLAGRLAYAAPDRRDALLPGTSRYRIVKEQVTVSRRYSS